MATVRDRIGAQLAAQIDAVTAATVYRNRGYSTLLEPGVRAVLVQDGPMDEDGPVDECIGLVIHQAKFLVVGCVGTATEEELGPASDALLDEIVRGAYAGDRRVGNLAIDISTHAYEPELRDEVGTRPYRVFAQMFLVEFQTAESNPSEFGLLEPGAGEGGAGEGAP